MHSNEQPRPLKNVDRALQRRLVELSAGAADFWSFARDARRAVDAAYFQYAAMMVPAMQGVLLESVLELQPNAKSVLDPFAGSGTVLAEAMCSGRSVHAQDVNPLAVLLCTVRQGPFDLTMLRENATAVAKRAYRDESTAIETELPNRAKWFSQRTVVQLSRIRRAIRRVDSIAVRRFLWISLAETVRQCSKSRTSTYKLHIRPMAEVRKLESPLVVFDAVVERNLERHRLFRERLCQREQLRSNRYIGNTSVRLQDSREPIDGTFDLLVTSPPYGDNRTTVPYGQHSYLPLNWIDRGDIPGFDDTVLRSTAEIDRRSLGGERQRGDLASIYQVVLDVSPSLRNFCQSMKADPPKVSKVLAFCRDLQTALVSALKSMNRNGYMFWTVGNRRVGDSEVPLDRFLTEVYESMAVVTVAEVTRTIPMKRMALRNSQSATMRAERVLVFRKAK